MTTPLHLVVPSKAQSWFAACPGSLPALGIQSDYVIPPNLIVTHCSSRSYVCTNPPFLTCNLAVSDKSDRPHGLRLYSPSQQHHPDGRAAVSLHWRTPGRRWHGARRRRVVASGKRGTRTSGLHNLRLSVSLRWTIFTATPPRVCRFPVLCESLPAVPVRCVSPDALRFGGWPLRPAR